MPNLFSRITSVFDRWRTDDSDSDSFAAKYEGLEDFQTLPLESSISALKAVALPRHLLDLAVLLFLLGIGLYELFLWVSREGEFGTNYRNIFIVFVVTIGIYSMYDLLIFSARSLDEDSKNYEFGTRTLGGSRRLEKLNKLEAQLAKVRERISIAATLDREAQQLHEQVQQIREQLASQVATTNELLAELQKYRSDGHVSESQTTTPKGDPGITGSIHEARPPPSGDGSPTTKGGRTTAERAEMW